MAINPCNECGHQVSDKAAGCPNCGAPIALKAKPKARAKRILYGVLIVLGAGLMAAALWRVETPDRLLGMVRSLSHMTERSPSAGPPVSAEPSSIAVQSPLAPDAAPPLVYQTTAQQLYQDYDTNAVATQSRIGTSRIRITGNIAGIDEDAAGHPIVKLWTSNGGSAEMTLNDDQKAAAAQLTKGETVDVQCDRMRHVVASPQGSGCALVLVYAGSGQAYLAVFLSTDRGNAPVYIAGPMSRAECLSRGDGISAQLSTNLKRNHVVSKNCAPTARESVPPEGCRLSSSMSAIPDMPTVHLWKYDCTAPAAAPRGSAATSAALHRAVPGIEVTKYAAAPEESAEPQAQTTAAPSEPGGAIAAVPALVAPALVAPALVTSALVTPTVAVPTVAALPGSPTPTPVAAALQNSTLPSTAAVTPGDAATVQPNVSTAPKVSAETAPAATAPKAGAQSAPAATAPNAGAESASAATAQNVSAESLAAAIAPKASPESAPAATGQNVNAQTTAAATAQNVNAQSTGAASAPNVSAESAADAGPSDLLTVRTADPGAADHIATYCKGASAAATDRDAVAAGCRREEVGAWTRLVLHNEFPALDAATRRKCNEPPFPDSYVAKESCAKYELRIN